MSNGIQIKTVHALIYGVGELGLCCVDVALRLSIKENCCGCVHDPFFAHMSNAYGRVHDIDFDARPLHETLSVRLVAATEFSS